MDAEKMLQLPDPTETACVVKKIDLQSLKISPQGSPDPTTGSLLGISSNGGQPTTSKQNLIVTQYLCTHCHAFTSDTLETSLQHFAKCRQADTVKTPAQCATSEKSSVLEDNDDDMLSLRVLWSPKETSRLIQFVNKYYGQLHSYTMPRKTVWQAIAQEFQGGNFCPPWENCDAKWRSLKKSYRRIKQKRGNTKSSKQSWMFYKAVDEVLANNPDPEEPEECVFENSSDLTNSGSTNTPRFTSANTLPHTPRLTSANTLPHTPRFTSANILPHAPRSTNSGSTNIHTPRKRRKIAQFRFEDVEERRHQERMANQRRYLSLLEKLIKKLD